MNWNRASAAVAAAVFLAAALASQPQSLSADSSPLSTAAVVHRMVTMNARRHAALHDYTFARHYHLEYHGLGREVADMSVRVVYAAPGPKHLTLISESGSAFVRHHVLEPIVQAEQKEADIENAHGSAFVPAYYSFTLADYPKPGIQPDYILAVEPRRDVHRFQFRGKIWIDPVDFGIVKAEGVSVHAPSWWVSHFDFSYQSQKIGDFWLPASNRCISHLRLLGYSVLDISNTDFDLTSFRPVNLMAEEARQ